MIRDLFECAYAHEASAPGRTPEWIERGGEALAPHREALQRLEQALLASLATAAVALRDGSTSPGAELSQASDSVERLVAALRARRELHSSLDPSARAAVLLYLSSRRQLVRRLLAIEAWLRDWRRAEASEQALAGSQVIGSSPLREGR